MTIPYNRTYWTSFCRVKEKQRCTEWKGKVREQANNRGSIAVRVFEGNGFGVSRQRPGLMFIHMSRTWYGAPEEEERGGGAGGAGEREKRTLSEISNIRTARRERQARCLPYWLSRARARDVRLAWFHYKNVTHRAASRRRRPLSTMRSLSRVSLVLSPRSLSSPSVIVVLATRMTRS